MTTYLSKKKRFSNVGIINPFGIIKLNNEMIEPGNGAYKAKCSKCQNFMMVFKDSFAGKRIKLSFELHNRALFQCSRCKHENYINKPDEKA